MGPAASGAALMRADHHPALRAPPDAVSESDHRIVWKGGLLPEVPDPLRYAHCLSVSSGISWPPA
jgi:hypothetical protein